MKVSKLHLEQLHSMLGQDELFEQDKDLLWLLRYEVRDRFPQYLSQLLQAVKWNNHIDVAKVSSCSLEFSFFLSYRESYLVAGNDDVCPPVTSAIHPWQKL